MGISINKIDKFNNDKIFHLYFIIKKSTWLFAIMAKREIQ